MELDEAVAHLQVKNAAPVDEVEDAIVGKWALEPQKEAAARMAFASIREGLGKLAALGHRFLIVEHDPSRVVERFPQMLYREGSDGSTSRTVESQAEFDEATADGWLPMQPGAPAVREAALQYAPGDGPLSVAEADRMQVLCKKIPAKSPEETAELAALEARNHPWPTAKIVTPATPARMGAPEGGADPAVQDHIDPASGEGDPARDDE